MGPSYGVRSEPRLALSVQPVPAGSVAGVHLDLVDAGSLPPVLREGHGEHRERHVVLSGRLGARFLARRTEAWSVLFDDGLDAADPRLRLCDEGWRPALVGGRPS